MLNYMRICFVTTTPATAIGGVENVVFNVMEQAKKAGYETDNVFAYDRYKNPLASLHAYKSVEKKIRKGSFDLVHSHDNASYYFARHNSVSAHLPVIHTSHGTWGNYFAAFAGLKKKILSRSSIKIEKFIAQHAYANTSVSFHVQKSLLEQYNVKSEVIHNGVDVEKFNANNKSKNKIPTGIWVGTNPELKGLDIAIEAVKMINLRLIVVGISGKDDSEMSYLGRVQPQQMSSLYKKADFLLFPSKYESHPIVPLEAMASGLPVIASSASNIEIIKNGKEGFIINGETEDYAAAIEKMLEKIKYMSAAARKLSMKYSWKKQAKKYFRLYDKIV